jgi:hypothetical protein
MTLVLFETAVCRPQTMYTTMLKSPTSVAMSRPTITLHWSNRALHLVPKTIQGSLRLHLKAHRNMEMRPVAVVIPSAIHAILLWQIPEDIRLKSSTTQIFEA